MSQKESIEREELYDKESEVEIMNPFDPKQVDIENKPMVLSNIVDRLKEGAIVLDPDFQRNSNLWDKRKQSRLIESLLIRIPLPTFYFDIAEDDSLIVVDGLQRLCAIRNFMAIAKNDNRCLRLEGLEYLKELEGMTYDELPINLQRRLREQTIQTYLIKSGTPDKVRNSIFERINTGGMILMPAEIKNSVYRGRAANLLKKMAELPEFSAATGGKIKSERMLDREFANRFLAFYLLGVDKYKGNLEDYLNDALIMVKDNETIDCNNIIKKFADSLKLSTEFFGTDSFKKINKNGKIKGMINKPLFEVTTVQFAKLTDREMKELKKRKVKFMEKYYNLLKKQKFVEVITNGTAKIKSVSYRHTEFKRIITESLGENND